MVVEPRFLHAVYGFVSLCIVLCFDLVQDLLVLDEDVLDDLVELLSIANINYVGLIFIFAHPLERRLKNFLVECRQFFVRFFDPTYVKRIVEPRILILTLHSVLSVLNVAVVGELLPSESLIWIVLQTAVQEFQPRCGKLYCLWYLVSSSCDVFQQILYAETCEGCETGEHFVVEATK